MAKFVESAILRVIDQSSSKFKEIERAMRSFRAEANKLSKIKIEPKVNTTKVRQATKDFRALTAAMQGAKGPRFDATGINSTTRALKALQQQVNRMKGLSVHIPTTGGMPPPGGNNRRTINPYGGTQSVRLQIGPLQAWADGFYYRLGATIENAIVSGFKKGTAEIDRSQTRLGALGYTSEQRAFIEDSSRQFSRENTSFTPSDFRQLYAELTPILGADPARAKDLVQMAAEFGNLQTILGRDADGALDGVRSIFKALDNMNRLNAENGGISGDARDYLKVLMQETVISGADITPEKINTAVVYSRTLGKTLSPEGLRTMIAMLESMGRVAGSSLNRFAQTFSGNTTKAAIKTQAEWGLVQMEQREVGRVGNKVKTENVISSTTAGDLLFTDPNEWMKQELIPRLLKRGANLSKPEEVARILSPLMGSVVAKDVALNLATWQKEYEARLEAALAVPTSPDQIRDEQQKSVLIQTNSLIDQTVEAMGEFGQAIGAQFLPGIKAARDIMMDIGDWIRADKENATVATGAAAAGGIIAAYGGVKGFQALMGATGLKGAASDLSSAARQLMRAATAMDGGPGGVKDNRRNRNRKNKNAPSTDSYLFAGGTLATVLAGIYEVYQNLTGQSETLYEQGTVPIPGLIDGMKALNNLGNTLKEYYNKSESNMSSPSVVAQMAIEAARKDRQFGIGGSSTETLPGKVADDFNVGLTNLADNIMTSGQSVSSEMMMAFTNGSALVTGSIQNNAPALGAAISAIAPMFGAAAGAAMSAAFNPRPVDVNVTATAGPDTGKNTNSAR